MTKYEAQSARDAQATGYGSKSYWDYLESSAKESRDWFLQKGQPELAQQMMTRSLSEALMGNESL